MLDYVRVINFRIIIIIIIIYDAGAQVWYRVIQIVINRDDVQGYAAKTVFEVSRCVWLVLVDSEQ